MGSVAPEPCVSTADGVTIYGTFFKGPRAAPVVLMLHPLGPGENRNKKNWVDLAKTLQKDFSVLTFDFRGYCPGGAAGCSQGSQDPNSRPTDLHAAIETIRSFGIERLGLIGSSLGGWAALTVAADQGDRLDVVVALSAISASGDDLRRISAPKLFMAGTGDDGLASLAQQFFDASSQPKRLVLLDTADHGAEMLRGSRSDEARAAVFDWLDRYLPV